MAALNVVRKFFPKVTHVVDANHNAAIEVTKADASSKAVKDHSACAMAVACQRKFKLDGVIISRTVAYLVKGKQARRFKMPPSVEREIVSFDRGGDLPRASTNYRRYRPIRGSTTSAPTPIGIAAHAEPNQRDTGTSRPMYAPCSAAGNQRSSPCLTNSAST